MYDTLVQSFSTLSPFDAWQDAQNIFQRAATGKPSHWLLPVHVCEAVGGTVEAALPSSLAVACAHISILLVDDMLDADPRGVHLQMGMPDTANLANAFQSAALEALESGLREAFSYQAALKSFTDMFLLTAYGQFLDLQVPADEESYWQIVRTKSSPFFGAAFQAGALTGGASLEISRRLHVLGRLYGEMVQVHDDLHDVMESPANPDWVQGRKPLPILFASLVRHPQRTHFLDLTRNIHETGALEEAQDILFQCGAVSYCVEHLLQKHQTAQTILGSLSLARSEPLNMLLESIIAPVRGLLHAVQ